MLTHSVTVRRGGGRIVRRRTTPAPERGRQGKVWYTKEVGGKYRGEE